MKQLLTVVLLLTASAAAQASPVETWECRDNYRGTGAILVTATVEPGRKRGSIAVAGVKHATVFQVAGFDRRWDFGLSNNRYAFIIEPNGNARYYDFGKKSEASASKLMQCIETGAANAPKGLPEGE